MPSAEIITIGTELLLGEIIDTNAPHIAQALRESGIDLYRKTTVGDNSQRIAAAIQEALGRCQIILTTGGLGPTVDDPTREAVAMAMGVETVFLPELWEQIKARFARFNRLPTENNRRQAFIPSGAIPIENPVGTAPSFIFEKDDKCVVALPGVPSEMKYLLEKSILPYLQQRYQIITVIRSRILHTAGVGESQIDDLIGDLETNPNPSVGLAAHSGQVDIRIVAKASSVENANGLITQVENELYHRLGNWIYGVDRDTLEGAALNAVKQYGWDLAVIEAGLGGGLISRLASLQDTTFRGGEILLQLPELENILRITDNYRNSSQAQVGLGVFVFPSGNNFEINIVLILPNKQLLFARPYGGSPEYAPRWALHHSLDVLRRLPENIG